MSQSTDDADDKQLTLMREFAKLRLKLGTCGRAADRMFPGDFPKCAEFVRIYENHPFVLAEMRRLQSEEPIAAQLPTKDELAQKLVRIGDDPGNTVQERLASYKMFADIMGYATKPGMGGAMNPYQQNVMETVKYATEDDWEKAARKQQTNLANAANAPSTDTAH